MRTFVLITIAALLNNVLCFTTTTQTPASTTNPNFFTLHFSRTDNLDQSTTQATQSSSRVAILVCPAQFCVPLDYDILFENLKQLQQNADYNMPVIGACRVAPLPRTEWIKVARQLPTQAFFQARLPVVKTLDWYFNAIDIALADILAQESATGSTDEVTICLIGHSIGGWIARAYLGGLSQSSTAAHRVAKITSLITLGTPHVAPEKALFDQTRGLIRAIQESPACQPRALQARSIDITCVCSDGVKGSFVTTNVEELIAASSYLPLLGRLDDGIIGDGIVPLDCAFLEEPARRIVVDKCLETNLPVRHSHVLPTPWNVWNGWSASIQLPNTVPSYVSKGVLPQWAMHIR
jgi:hypothetical protein